MASVKIFEKDYTESSAYEPTETVVYIPGMPGNNYDSLKESDRLAVNTPKVFSTVASFVAAVGNTPKDLSTGEGEAQITAYDKSYIEAKQLLALGVSVLYEIVSKLDDLSKPAETEDELRNRLADATHWSKLYDRALYNPRFITSGGYASVITTDNGFDASVANNMINCAQYSDSIGRGDCVALIDHELSLNTLASINELFNGNNSPFKNLGTKGTYGAAFTPWCSHSISVDLGNVNSPDDTVNGTWALPPSFTYLGAYVNSIGSNNPTWYAAAGVTRGTCPTLVKPLVEFGEVAANSFQSREDGMIGVNPICYINPYGYRVFGNRTLRQNGIDNKSNLVATSFLNIRNLISDIKKTSFAACRRMSFEQNTDVLWFNLKGQITPLLDKMKTGNGISDYRLVRVATKEKAKVVGKIKIIPIEAVEDFELTVELMDSLETETEE